MTKTEKATRWMEATARDNSHGYDQAYRWNEKGDYDCSSAVYTAWVNAGIPVKDYSFKTYGCAYTGVMKAVFTHFEFKDVQKEVQQFKDNRIHDRDQSFDIQKQLTDSQTLLQNSVENLRKMLVNKEINDMRWEILDFSNAVMNGRVYNKEIYDHIFDTYTEYERVLEENGLENGKVDSSMQFVRNKYLELMEKSFKQ